MLAHPTKPIISRGLGLREGGGATPTLDFSSVEILLPTQNSDEPVGIDTPVF